ncbi:adhesion G-protein coupled receptor G2-like [Haliotis asinina]|uniref:adhesion G-protein coupled receptor G2-like n=1 Tax=Haliotis asinina TaxID=109174 RepID=UPI0035326724
MAATKPVPRSTTVVTQHIIGASISVSSTESTTSHTSLTSAQHSTSTKSPTDAPDRTSAVSPSGAQHETSTVSPSGAPDTRTPVSSTDAPDRTSTIAFTTDYKSTTFVPEMIFIDMWVNAVSTPTVPLGGNSLDRLLNVHVKQGNTCPFGLVYYDGSCHVTWHHTTPRPLPSTQKHLSARRTAGTSIQPRSTKTPHVQPPLTRKHIQTPASRLEVQSSTRVHVNSTSSTRDSISSPSSPSTENDVIQFNEHAPSSSPTTHYTGGHSKHHSTTGTSEDESSAVTASTITSPGHVLHKDDTHSTTSHLQCSHVILDNSTFNLNPDGSVVLKGGKVINESDFILTPKGQLKVCVTTLGLQGSNTNEKFKIDRNRPTVVLTNICLVSSQVFLILTFLFHCFFSSLRNLPGVILMFLSASLFLAHATFFFWSDEAHNRTTCITIGVVIHFFWLASFCWLNISSFHTFRVFKDVFASRSFEANKKRIILIYSIFGYGIPAVVITANITVNYFVSGSESFGYADTSNFCFVSIGTNSIVGLLVPAGVTILVSFTLFILTVVYLCKASANRRKVGNGEKWNILMYIKLSTITGFSWVFGFLQMVDNSQVFTYLFIFLTGAQGVFIFLAFMANKRTFLLIKHACRKQNLAEIPQNRLTLTQNVMLMNMTEMGHRE